MEYVLQVNDLTIKYGKATVLKGMNLKVPKNSIYGLIGRNGAGKTTLFRTVCGMQEPDGGGYLVYGAENGTRDIYSARRRMAAIVESPSIYKDMTAYQNMKYQFDILGLKNYERINELLELVGIPDTGKKKTKDFSLGMRQRLGIAIALAGNPEFVMLDEPVNGLDPQGIVELRELIIKLNKEKNITFVISSHILDELSRMATHYGIMDGGRVLEELSAEALMKKCRQCIKITVSDMEILKACLEELSYEYDTIEGDTAQIYGDVNINKLVVALDKKNCQVQDINCTNEDLESYFIKMVGGESNA